MNPIDTIWESLFGFMPFDLVFILVLSLLLGIFVFARVCYTSKSFWDEASHNVYKIFLIGLVTFFIVYSVVNPISLFWALFTFNNVYTFDNLVLSINTFLISLVSLSLVVLLYPTKTISQRFRKSVFLNKIYLPICFILYILIIFSSAVFIFSLNQSSEFGWVALYFLGAITLLVVAYILFNFSLECLFGDLSKNEFQKLAAKKVRSYTDNYKGVFVLLLIIGLIFSAIFIIFPTTTEPPLQIKTIHFERNFSINQLGVTQLYPFSYELTFIEDLNFETMVLNKFLVSYNSKNDSEIKWESLLFDYNFGETNFDYRIFNCKGFEKEKELLLSKLENYSYIVDKQGFKAKLNSFSMTQLEGPNNQKDYCLFIGQPFSKYSLRREYGINQEYNVRFEELEYYIDLNYVFDEDNCRGNFNYNRKVPVKFNFRGDFIDYNLSEPTCGPQTRDIYCSIYYQVNPDTNAFGISLTATASASNSGFFYVDFDC